MHLSEITLLGIKVYHTMYSNCTLHVQGYIKEVEAFVPLLYLDKTWRFFSVFKLYFVSAYTLNKFPVLKIVQNTAKNYPILG